MHDYSSRGRSAAPPGLADGPRAIIEGGGRPPAAKAKRKEGVVLAAAYLQRASVGADDASSGENEAPTVPRRRIAIVDANDGVVALGANARQILGTNVTEQAPDGNARRCSVGGDHCDGLAVERMARRELWGAATGRRPIVALIARIPYEPARIEVGAWHIGVIVGIEQAVDGQVSANGAIDGDVGGTRGLTASGDVAVRASHGGAVAGNVSLAHGGAGGVANDEIDISYVGVHEVCNEPGTGLVLFTSELERRCWGGIDRRVANRFRQLV